MKDYSSDAKTNPMRFREFRTTAVLAVAIQLAIAMASAFVFKRAPSNLISEGILSAVCVGTLIAASRVKNELTYIVGSAIVTVSAVGLMYIGPMRETRTITFVIAAAIATLIMLIDIAMVRVLDTMFIIIATAVLVAILVVAPFSIMEYCGGPVIIPLFIVVQIGGLIEATIVNPDDMEEEYDANSVMSYSNTVCIFAILAGLVAASVM